MKKTFITEVTGQGGAYLFDFFVKKRLRDLKGSRRSSICNTTPINYLHQEHHNEGARFFPHYGDMAESTNLLRIIQQVNPS